MQFFVADTHYGHKNIVRDISQWGDLSGCRDFPDQQSHDNWVVKTINARVQADDILYHLGDWSFGGENKVYEFRERLTCENIHVILGNHDYHIPSYQRLFRSVGHYLELSVEGVNLVLCHYPIDSWNNMERGAIHLHGHVHGKGEKKDGRYDVGMEAVGLLSLDDVRLLPRSNRSRHGTVHGGNKFGTGRR